MIPPCIPVIRLGLAILGSSVCLTTPAAQGAAQELRIEIRPQFSRAPLILDTPGNLAQPGQTVSVTRLDFLLSNFALRNTQGVWFYSSNRFAHISIRDGKTSFVLRGLAKENVDRIRFYVGVPPKENHASPGQFDAHHPLNPNLNGLHWDWEGGYVFVAVEGIWKERSRGYSFHIATDAHLMTVELPVRLQTDQASSLQISFNVDGLFSHPNEVRLTDETLSTHSRAGDPVAHKLRINIEHAFEAIGTLHPSTPTRSDADSAGTISRALVSSQATPHRFAFPSYYPQPALPLDNPLTLQGIALGQRLFEDPQLSAGNKQSCASCHQAASGFADAGKRYSVGADGRVGTRNTMPLFNLAWRHSFFWDGRAATLREQVLQPIENPVEMGERLTQVLEKLRGSPTAATETVTTTEGQAGGGQMHVTTDYPDMFEAAFGTREISADRLARALEQYLVAQVESHSKLDRVLAGVAEFTIEEKRGFTLFHTEYDPRRGQFGADCFHCHGGPLFQSQGFASNGLDLISADAGRAAVTERDSDHGKFAVPSLRNIALTAPYMHDGRFSTLEQVVEHYSTGVRRSSNLDPNLAKHPEGGIGLSDEDKRALVAFLKTLTGERSSPTDFQSTAR